MPAVAPVVETGSFPAWVTEVQLLKLALVPSGVCIKRELDSQDYSQVQNSGALVWDMESSN